MIYSALQFLCKELNGFLQRRFALQEEIAQLNHLVDIDGSPSLENANKVVITLLNLEKEREQFYNTSQKLRSSGNPMITPDSGIDLSVMMAANFEDYDEGLKFVDAVYQFFEANSTFNNQGANSLPNDIDSMRVELINTSASDLQDYFRMLGANYRPSLIYKVRSLLAGISTVNIEGQNPLVSE